MQVAVLMYPGCIFFEIALATEILARQLPVRYYTPDGQPHQASNGSTVASAGDLSALRSASTRAVLVPGGDPRVLLLPRPVATAALQEQSRSGVLIAGICAGNLVMASAGLMNGRRGTHNYTSEYASPEKVAATDHFWNGMNFVRANLVQDGNLITSQPWAYRQYAAAIGRVLGVLSEAEAAELESYIARRTYSACLRGQLSSNVRPHMDTLWVLTVVLISAVALTRWHRFNMLMAKIINGVESEIGPLAANVLRVVAVFLMFFGIIYFFTSSVQFYLKYLVFERCLPEESFVSRLFSCLVGNPFQHLKK